MIRSALAIYVHIAQVDTHFNHRGFPFARFALGSVLARSFLHVIEFCNGFYRIAPVGSTLG